MTTSSSFDVGIDPSDNYDRFARPLMAPFVDELINRASLREGVSVLDVACGTGFVARAAATHLGPDDRVAAIDLNGPRLEFARRATEGFGPRIEWHEASVERMPFGDEEFDAVLSQQGIQHFPHLQMAIREMSRVCRREGRVVVSFWSPLERQGYFGSIVDVGARYFTAEAIGSLRNGAFSLEPQSVANEFRSRGQSHVEVDEVIAWADLPPPQVFLPGQFTLFTALAEQAQQLSTGRRSALFTELASALAPYRTQTGMHVPLASWVVTASR